MVPQDHRSCWRDRQKSVPVRPDRDRQQKEDSSIEDRVDEERHRGTQTERVKTKAVRSLKETMMIEIELL